MNLKNENPRQGGNPSAGNSSLTRRQSNKPDNQYTPVSVFAAIREFHIAAAERGGRVPETPVIGKLSRCEAADGRRGNRDFAYVFYVDGRPAGGFQNFKDGLGWQRWRFQGNVELSPTERRACQESRQHAQARRDLHARAREEARKISRTLFRFSETLTLAETRLALDPDDRGAWAVLEIVYRWRDRLEYKHDMLLSRHEEDRREALQVWRAA